MQNNNLRELSPLQSGVFMLGGLLMVVGMGLYVFMIVRFYASVAFLVGAVLFAVMQCSQIYLGQNRTIQRLKNIMNMADLLFVLAGIIMVDSTTHFLRPIFNSQIVYIQYVYNKWLVLLMIAVMLEVYTVHRISAEIKKQQNGEG